MAHEDRRNGPRPDHLERHLQHLPVGHLRRRDEGGFTYTGNPLGTNADGNQEVFLYEPAAAPALRQLTVTTKGNQAYARFSRDGHYVVFQSDSSSSRTILTICSGHCHRYDMTTSTLQRSGGLRNENLGISVASTTTPSESYPHEVSNDGSVVAYATFSDSIGKNPDEYWEIMTLDYNAPNPR